MKPLIEQQPASDTELFHYARSRTLPPAPYVIRSETSKAAADSQTDNKRLIDMARIYRFTNARGPFGATCDEMEVSLGIIHATCSARCSEMSNPKKNTPFKLVKNGLKRPTRTGCRACVYEAIHET